MEQVGKEGASLFRRLKTSPWRYLVWALLSLLLLLMAVVAAISTFLATESGSRAIAEWGVDRVNQIDDVELRVTSMRGNLLQGLSLSSVRIDTPQAQISVSEIVTEWDAFSLLRGEFQLALLQLSGVDLLLSGSPSEAAESAQSPVFEIAFEPLPVSIVIAELRITEFDWSVDGGIDEGIDESIDGNVDEGASEPVGIERITSSVALRGRRLHLTNLEAELELGTDVLELQGDMETSLESFLPVSGDLFWRYLGQLPGEFTEATGELTLSGRVDDLQIDHQLHSPFAIHSTGRVQPLSLDGVKFDLRHEAQSIELPESIAIPQRPLAFREVELLSRGTFDQLSFSMNTVTAMETLPQLGEIVIALDGDLGGDRVSLSAQINSATGQLQSSAIASLGDELQVSGSFLLQEQNPLAVFGSAAGMSPTLVESLAMTELASQGVFEVSMTEQGPGVSLTLEEATAMLGDYRVLSRGGASWSGSELQLQDIVLRSTANELRVSGSVSDDILLDWSITAPELHQFIPGVRANVLGGGTVSGELAAPFIEASVDVDSLSSDLASLESLQLSLSGDPSRYAALLNFRGAEISLGEEILHISDAGLEFAGLADSHQLSVSFEGEYLQEAIGIDASLAGGTEQSATSVQTGEEGLAWLGQLERASVSTVGGDWSLLSPGQLRFSDQQISLSESCWTPSITSTQACVSVTPDGQDRYILDGSIGRLPLQQFNASTVSEERLMNLAAIPTLPEGVALEGLARATLYAELEAQALTRFNVVALADDTLLTLRSAAQDQFGADRTEAEINEQAYTWSRLSLRADYQQGNWQFDSRALLDTQGLQDSELALSGEMSAELLIDADGNLDGSSQAEFSDLGWVSAFIPEMRNVTGLLDSSLHIGGTLSEPVFNGDVRINEAGFFLERTGVSYSDLEISLSGTSISSAALEGSLATDDGFLTYSGSLSGFNSPDWQLNLEVEGEAFQVSNLDDLTLHVSPSLNLDANARRIDLAGRLHVPVLHMLLLELPESGVDISRDVVIRNHPEDRPELARSFSSGQTSMFDLPITADLVLSLGDEVSFDGFGLQASLAGELEVQQHITGSSFTYGELVVTNGHYRIYGQELSLRDGKLLFLGNYANPALDIRAVREVRGQTVGVLINGTLNAMRSQLFSSPALPESDVLAVLVTGRPAAQLQSSDGEAVLGAITSLGIERGQSLANDLGDRLGFDTVAITNTGNIDSSELTVGKYLTPQVFVRYGVGLFDSVSKIAVDYFINDRLTLQAESGEYQSIDFTYRVER